MNRYLLSFAFILLVCSCTKDNPTSPKAPADLLISQENIVLNPTGFAPLSALLSYTYPSAGKTKITVFGKNGEHSTIQHVFNDYGSSHSVPITGLYANYNNTIHILLTNDRGDSIAKSIINIQTGALPLNLPISVTVDAVQYRNMEPGLNLVSSFNISGNTDIPYMIDNYGDIRWLLDFSAHPVLKALSYHDGTARLKNGNFYFGNITTNKIYEVDVLGKIINTWGLSGYIFHHEVLELPDGNFLLSATNPSSIHKNGSPTVEDYVIEIDRQTGNLKNVWDLKESLDENRTALTNDRRDWLHINALYYDAADHTIIVSGRTQGVVKLTYDNRIKWILGPHKGWGKNRRGEDLNQFLLQPLDAKGNRITDTSIINGYSNHPDFEWSWFQHSPILIPNGNLMLFDNGSTRNYNVTSSNPYSRAVEYKIDPVNMTIRQIWEYGKERGVETFSRVVSNVEYLPLSNHVLFCPGYQVVNAKGQGGKVVEVDYATKQVVFQASISFPVYWGFHRAKRISAYP